MIDQLLQATHFQRYINTLAQLTQQPNHIAAFEQAQQQAWAQALLALEVTANDQPATIQAAVQERVALLQQIIQDTFTDLTWTGLLNTLRPQLPADLFTCYALKPTVIERLLRQQPPLHTMQYLGYETLDECLAKESLYELMAALRFSESSDWMQLFLQQYAQLTAADFELRPVQFLTLESSKWWRLAEPFARKKRHHFSHLKEAGVVFWYPSPDATQPQDQSLAVVMMLLHYLFEVHFYSQWFQTQAAKLPNFGEVFVATLQGDTELCARDLYHLPIIQQYHLKQPNPHPCVFQPHVMPEALHWRKAMTALMQALRLHPDYDRVAFWETCYTVGALVQGELVTLNIVDNVLSTTVQFNYHFREDMWNAIFAHYYSPEQLEQTIIHYFASKQIDLNDLRIQL